MQERDANMKTNIASKDVIQPNVWYPRLGPLLPYAVQNIILSRQSPEAKNFSTREFVYLDFNPNNINKIFKKDGNLYEILPENLPRKFPVDIDIKPSHKNYNKYTYKEIVNAMNTIIKFCSSNLNFSFFETEVITSIVKKIDRKQSLHIIYPLNFQNQHDALLFARYVEDTIINSTDEVILDAQQILKNNNEIYFDKSIYSVNQNLRMIYQSKKEYPGYIFEPYDKKIKEPIKYLAGIYQDIDIIKFVDCTKLELILTQKIYKKIYKTNPEKTKKAIENVRNIINYIDEFTYLVQYDELPKPIFTYKDEIEFLVLNIPNNNKNPQNYSLWYAIGQTLKNISDKYKPLWIQWSNKASEVFKSEDKICNTKWESLTVREGKKYLESFLIKILHFYYPGIYDKYKALNLFSDLVNIEKFKSKFDEVVEYNERYCIYDNLQDFDGYLLRSAMGTGKTYIINRLIQDYKFKRILLISPRQTFSKNKCAELRKIFPDFIDYLDIADDQYNWLRVNRFGIQVESLKRLSDIDISSAYDLVILDEVESILNQISSTTNGGYSKENFKTMLDIIKLSKKFVMTDAYVLARSATFASTIRELFNKKVKLVVNNYTYPERKAVILGIAKNPNSRELLERKLISQIITSLKNGKKIYLCVWSKTFERLIIEAIKQELGEDFVTNHVKYYDSTVNATVMKDLENVTKSWSGPKVKFVLFTGKITVGVDFSKKGEFDDGFIFGSSMCPIARDIIQGHFRVREVKSNTIYVALYADPNVEIKHTLQMENRKNNFIRDYFDSNEYDFYDKICDYNTLESHIGIHAYDKIFLHFLKEVGYTIEYDNKKSDNNIDIDYLKNSYLKANIVKNYQNLKRLENYQIRYDELQQKIIKKTTTDLEVSIWESYNFYIYIVANTILLHLEEDKITDIIGKKIFKNWKNEAIDITINQYIENNLFNLYYLQKDKQIYLINMVTEWKNEVINYYIMNNREKVIARQKEVLKLAYIKDLCLKLELKHSYDTNTKISEDKVLKYYEYYLNLDMTQKNLFNELFVIKELKAKDKIMQAKQLINLILKYWNGHKFTRYTTKKTNNNGERHRIYEYYVEEQDDLFMKIFEFAIS
jgi:hypothetical protein